ncbi:MAG: spore cortex-lytic enzyme [Oscillospiraceae bacterium]
MKGKSIPVFKLLLILVLNIFVVSFVSYSFHYHIQDSLPALSKMGSRGDEVIQIQKKLKEYGVYSGNIDGIYGTQTEKGVRAVQRYNGLTVDGIAGPQTLRVMGISSGSSSSSGGGTSASQSDINLLARIISAEARGEPYEGQVAVGAVVLNRVEHPSFPDTFAGVVYQPGAFTAITDGQFNQPVADSAYNAARDALNGWDPSGGAIYYYNPDKTSNKWIRTRPVIKRIGNHLFAS